jgi:hypothetical protein
MHQARIRPSVQRIAVLANIANKRKHPTADEIFTDLVTEYPSMSKTTVYNSLHILVEANLVRELEIESGNKRYDLAPQPPHSHFICRKCGRIFDMELPAGLEKIPATGFSIDSMDVYFKGICQQCNQSN